MRKHCQGPNGREQEDGTNMQVKYDFNALFICTAMNYSRRLQQEGRDTVHLANSTTPFTAPGRKVTAVHCRRPHILRPAFYPAKARHPIQRLLFLK